MDRHSYNYNGQPRPSRFTSRYTSAHESRPSQNTLRSPQEGAHPAHPAHPAQPAQLYMGDLPAQWKEDTVRDLWTRHGLPPRHVKVVWQPGRLGTEHQGYCFVDFATVQDAERALAMAGQPLGHGDSEGRRLRLNWAAGSGRAAVRNPAVRNPAGNTGDPAQHTQRHGFSVFVGDLQPSVTEPALLALFQQRLPSAEHARVVRDPVTGLGRGYGFVRFAAEADMHRALQEMGGQVLDGRPIKVGSTSTGSTGAASSRRANATATGTATGTSATAEAAPPRKHRTPRQTTFVAPQQQQPGESHYTDRANATLYASGLPASVGPQELHALFAPFGELSLVRLLPGAKGTAPPPPPPGSAAVQFLSRSSAEHALRSLQGYPLGPRGPGGPRGAQLQLSWGAVPSAAETTLRPRPLFAPLV